MDEPTPPIAAPHSLPLGELEWSKFVDWAASHGDTVESDWLELKSDVDPTSRTGAAKIARFILAAANRDPDDAARNLSGHAVLLLGITAGTVKGLQPVENLQLKRVIEPFLGDSGPRWDVVRVPGSDGEVLAFVVQPPRQGDPIHAAQKNGVDIRDGQIYVRVDGASEPNTSSQLERLIGRSRSVAEPTHLEVSIDGAVGVFVYQQDAVFEILEELRRKYLAKLPSKQDVEYPSALKSVLQTQAQLSAISAMQRPEERTEREFREEIDRYIQACRAAVPALAKQIMGGIADPITIRLTNKSQQFLKSIELVIHVSGKVEALPSLDQDTPMEDVFPYAPRSWGPRLMDLGMSSINASLLNRSYQPGPIQVPDPSSWSSFRNGGSIDGTVGFKTLRPRATVKERTDAVFVTSDTNITELVLDWSATAADVHDVFEGQSPLDVRDCVDITEELRELARDLLMPST